MRFRVWHLMLAMMFVAIWLPVAKWLLVLEALDHPGRPQTMMDYIGFYLGSTVFVAIPLSLVALVFRKRT